MNNGRRESGYEELFERLQHLEEQVERLETQSRRNNVKIFGVPVTGRQSYDNCAKLVVELLNQYAVFKRWGQDDVERAHRIGKADRSNNRPKPRPVIVKLCRWQDKLDLLRDRRSRDALRRAGFRLSADLTNRQAAQLRDHRAQGRRAYFRNGRLHVEEEKEERRRHPYKGHERRQQHHQRSMDRTEQYDGDYSGDHQDNHQYNHPCDSGAYDHNSWYEFNRHWDWQYRQYRDYWDHQQQYRLRPEEWPTLPSGHQSAAPQWINYMRGMGPALTGSASASQPVADSSASFLAPPESPLIPPPSHNFSPSRRAVVNLAPAAVTQTATGSDNNSRLNSQPDKSTDVPGRVSTGTMGPSQTQHSLTDSADLVSAAGGEVSGSCGDDRIAPVTQHSHTDGTDLVSAAGVGVSEDNSKEPQSFLTDSTDLVSAVGEEVSDEKDVVVSQRSLTGGADQDDTDSVEMYEEIQATDPQPSHTDSTNPIGDAGVYVSDEESASRHSNSTSANSCGSDAVGVPVRQEVDHE